jgi:AcrR family transcriptional regulator
MTGVVDPPGAADDGRAAPLSPRGQRTRERLLVAAREIFERDGIVNARVTDIAERAGVAYGSFYTYFESKEDVFAHVAVAALNEIDEVSAASYGGDSPAPVAHRAAMRAYLDAHKREGQILALLEQVATADSGLRERRDLLRSRVIDRIARLIGKYQREGLADQDMHTRCMATALGSLVESFPIASRSMDFSDEVAVDTLSRIWLGGIGFPDRGAVDTTIPSEPS